MRATLPGTTLLLLAGVACNSFDSPNPESRPLEPSPTIAGGPTLPSTRPPPLQGFGGAISISPVPVPNDLGAECDASVTVSPDSPALLVRDPAVLAAFPLERTLEQIARTANVTFTPEQLLQRLFDTENTSAGGVFPDVPHCDDPANLAFANAKAVDCPRAEALLAKSVGMLTPGSPDFFAPVALVNRFDLTPEDRATCGEYRIIYAKQSGRTDPQDRVFLIFEAALFNSSQTLSECRPVAELWQGLAQAGAETQKARLTELFFTGLGTLEPVITAAHLGATGSDCQYTGRCGQIRLGQGMQAPFEFRQFRLLPVSGLDQPSRLAILPTADAQSPRPELFDQPSKDPQGGSFPSELLGAVPDLSARKVAWIRARTSPVFDAGESALSGPARPNFAERLAASNGDAGSFFDLLKQRITTPDPLCPSDDQLTPDALVQRATALTCAGCHAPEQVLAEGRKLGCGAVWPKSLGETHINELGELSPALTDVFLPQRADVLTTFLQACDPEKVEANLQPAPPVIRLECFPPGTPITLADGTEKPIEQVRPSEWVLSFDRATGTLLPAPVSRLVVRQDAQRFVRINDALVATDNHPFLTEAGWVRSVDLQVGATLLSLAARHGLQGVTSSERAVQPLTVGRLSLETRQGPTYNLHVEGQHNYFAGGLLVHDQP